MLRRLFLASLASFICASAIGTAPASAEQRQLNPVKTYASILRVLNPKLPDWQRRKYATSVLANAMRTKVDPRFIMAVVAVESSWQAGAVSRVGARGLGQLMPGTAAELRVNPWDASQNLRGTASYLKFLLDRYRGQQQWFEKAIAGYNAGPDAVNRFGGIPPYAETQRYVVKVLAVYRHLYSTVAIAWTPYVSHRRPGAAVDDEPSALSDAARRATAPLAAEAMLLAPIPAFGVSATP